MRPSAPFHELTMQDNLNRKLPNVRAGAIETCHHCLDYWDVKFTMTRQN